MGAECDTEFQFVLEKGQEGAGDGKTFKDYTLFLPAVSVGHVGQLTTDLLLANVPAGATLKKIGRIFHPALEAVVGLDIHNAKGSPPGLMTSCEVFEVAELKFVIVHFHAPVTMKGRTEFVQCLLEWIQNGQFSLVVCFTSVFGADRIDPQLVGVPFRFLSTDLTPAHLLQKLQEMEWKPLERRQFPAPAIMEKSDPSKEDENEGVIHLPGSGITKLLFEECEEKKVPFLGLVMFASEGDNTPEAMALFQMADRLFSFRSLVRPSPTDKQDNSPGEERLIVPISWTHFEQEGSHSMLY